MKPADHSIADVIRAPWPLVLMSAVLAWAASVAAAESSPPDIIFVMADDMGWGQTGYRGHPVLKTPHLDAMAASGLRFERFYAGCPACSPIISILENIIACAACAGA